MSKKIVFVGPPGVGKTTLRKIFFEFESAEQLLQFAIDPTYGVESIVLNFGQEIGIFDLSGQENEKWLENDEMNIFLGSSNIIIVVDATKPVAEIIKFVEKVLNVREKVAMNSMIYLLVHKVDLLNAINLKVKIKEINDKLRDINKFKVEFTSIKPPHILGSISVFKNIVIATLEEEIPFERLDYDLINDILTFFSLFRSKTRFKEKTLMKISGFSKERLDEITELLVDKKFLQIEEDMGKNFSLTMEKRTNFIEILEKYSREKFSRLEEKYKGIIVPVGVEVPPFIGFIIADKIGRTLLAVEQLPGDFIKYIGMDKDDEIDLVSPFLCALDQFSREINMVNFGNLRLRGENSTMFVFKLHNFLITFFLNKNANLDMYKEALKDFIVDLLKNNSENFMRAINSGNTTHLQELEEGSRKWLKQLNKSYQEDVKRFNVFDIEKAKNLYEKLEDYSERLNSSDETTRKSLRKLKSQLINAIMEKDLMEVREIAEECEKLALSA